MRGTCSLSRGLHGSNGLQLDFILRGIYIFTYTCQVLPCVEATPALCGTEA